MDRTVYINIGGKEYPMRFSLAASRAISEKYGSMKKMSERMSGNGGESSEAETFDVMAEITEILIRQGCAYKNFFEADMPIPENAPVENGKYVPISKEGIEIGLDMADMKELQGKIFQAFGVGAKRTIEAEPKDHKTKKNE